MQESINALEGYCKHWEKTKALIFKQQWRRLASTEKWFLNDVEMEVVKSYKYL